MTEVLDPTAVPMDTAALGAIPEISFDTELVDESQPYLGVVVLDEYQPNYNKDGYQWVLGVRPVDFTVKGELACFFSRNNISTSPTSKMGMTLKSIQAHWGKEKKPIGRGHLKGRIGVFVNRNVSFGTADDGTERKARVTLLVRPANDEETARAQGIAQAILAGTAIPDGSEPAPVQVTQNPALMSEEEQEKIIAVLEGKTPAEFQMAALSSGLPPALMNAILNGSALKSLLDSGAVTQDADGRVSASLI